MWLLDKNVPEQLIPVLRSFSIILDTAKNRGWGDLRNGELLSAASAAKFNCILTRDTLFQEDARKALEKHPHMALILLTIPQMPGKKYAETFLTSWKTGPIVPAPGQLLFWPK